MHLETEELIVLQVNVWSDSTFMTIFEFCVDLEPLHTQDAKDMVIYLADILGKLNMLSSKQHGKRRQLSS